MYFYFFAKRRLFCNWTQNEHENLYVWNKNIKLFYSKLLTFLLMFFTSLSITRLLHCFFNNVFYWIFCLNGNVKATVECNYRSQKINLFINILGSKLHSSKNIIFLFPLLVLRHVFDFLFVQHRREIFSECQWNCVSIHDLDHL